MTGVQTCALPISSPYCPHMETQDLPPQLLCCIVHRPLAGSLPGSFPFYRETVTTPHHRAGGHPEPAWNVSGRWESLRKCWLVAGPALFTPFVTCQARGDTGFETCCRRRNQLWPFLSSFLHLHRFPPAPPPTSSHTQRAGDAEPGVPPRGS